MTSSRPPELPTSEPPRSSWLTLLLAGCGLLVGAIFLLLLPTGFIGPAVVFGGFTFVGIIGFHYVVWGRWLNRVLAEEKLRQEEELNALSPTASAGEPQTRA